MIACYSFVQCQKFADLKVKLHFYSIDNNYKLFAVFQDRMMWGWCSFWKLRKILFGFLCFSTFFTNFPFLVWKPDSTEQTDQQVSAWNRRLHPPEDLARPLEGLPSGSAFAGAVQELAHAEGLQHQRKAQPHGDPCSAPHAAFLEGKLKKERNKECKRMR